MSERILFRTLAVLLVAALGAVYAIAPTRDNGPSANPFHDGLARLEWAQEPKPLPEITFEARDGKAVTPAEFRGRVVLLNFWATWCLPCLQEMPALDRLQATLGGPEFTVVTVSTDRKPGDAWAWVRENKVDNLPVYSDPRAGAWTALGMTTLPMSVIVDREGREVARLTRPAAWDSEEAVGILREVMARPPASPDG